MTIRSPKAHSSTPTTALPRSDALRRKRKWRCLPPVSPSPTAAWMKPEIMDSNGKGDFQPFKMNLLFLCCLQNVRAFKTLYTFIQNHPLPRLTFPSDTSTVMNPGSSRLYPRSSDTCHLEARHLICSHQKSSFTGQDPPIREGNLSH